MSDRVVPLAVTTPPPRLWSTGSMAHVRARGGANDLRFYCTARHAQPEREPPGERSGSRSLPCSSKRGLCRENGPLILEVLESEGSLSPCVKGYAPMLSRRPRAIMPVQREHQPASFGARRPGVRRSPIENSIEDRRKEVIAQVME